MGDQSAEGLLSPFLREHRIAAARPYLHGRVLDVGCGTGALAAQVSRDRYIGCDSDSESIAVARANHAGYRFLNSMPPEPGGFDTVVALAVIEHIVNPVEFLRTLRFQLRPAPTSRIILTTPNPFLGTVHALGAKIGLFSRQANKEHQKLLDRNALEEMARASNCQVFQYRKFLWAANQLFIITLKKTIEV